MRSTTWIVLLFLFITSQLHAQTISQSKSLMEYTVANFAGFEEPAIPLNLQDNLRNYLGLMSSGIAAFGPCIPGVNPATAMNVPVGAGNAYEPFSVIKGLHMQVLWAVSLSDCYCACP